MGRGNNVGAEIVANVAVAPWAAIVWCMENTKTIACILIILFLISSSALFLIGWGLWELVQVLLDGNIFYDYSQHR